MIIHLNSNRQVDPPRSRCGIASYEMRMVEDEQEVTCFRCTQQFTADTPDGQRQRTAEYRRLYWGPQP